MSKKFDKGLYVSKRKAGVCAAHGCAQTVGQQHAYCSAHRQYFANQARFNRMTKPERAMMSQAKKRAKRRGTPFNLTLRDIVIPKTCPVLGIALVRGEGTGGAIDSSPSLDCFRPALGYVVGNVAVISYRANRIKCDASLEELEKVTDWVRRTQ
jgi:hypothetical protein